MPDKKHKYFKLHLNDEQHHKLEIKPTPYDNNHAKDSSPKKEKRSIKNVLKDAGRQIIASAIILVIAFVLLNFSALSQIAQSKWNKTFGIETQSPLVQYTEIDTENVAYSQEVLETSNDLGVKKQNIPSLDLEIAPIDSRIIIPRIDQNIPIVKVSSKNLIKRDWSALEKEMQDALQDGVVHYPGTSLPGQTGNVVITGHSSYFPWDPGRFKDVFALLHEVVVGDRIVIYFEQDKYLYEVQNITIVLPEDIEVLKQTPGDKLTLITCTPVGTNLKRLIVTAKPIAINGKKIEL